MMYSRSFWLLSVSRLSAPLEENTPTLSFTHAHNTHSRQPRLPTLHTHTHTQIHVYAHVYIHAVPLHLLPDPPPSLTSTIIIIPLNTQATNHSPTLLHIYTHTPTGPQPLQHHNTQATMPQMSWEETRSIMAEVQELFAGREVRTDIHTDDDDDNHQHFDHHTHSYTHTH